MDGSGSIQQLLKYIARWDRRLRLSQTTLWLPRGLAISLILAILVAGISRLRPWLLTSQLIVFAVGASILALIITAFVVWWWPRSAIQAARLFDKRFGLQERVSTALELRDGAIKAPEDILALQAQDSIRYAKQINASRAIPLQVRRKELFGVLTLIVALALLLLLANPQSEVVAQQQAIQSAIQQQADKLDEIKKDIDKQDGLTDEDKAKLKDIVQQAQDKLKQSNVTQPEAVAALSEAQQKLDDAANQLTQEQMNALNQAGRAMTGSPVAQDVGQALQNGQLGEAANALNSLANRAGENQLTAEQRQDLAAALRQAAEQLASTNPAAAEAMQRAADALEKGDLAAAQQALKDAADALNKQQQQQQQTVQSQAANNAANQINQSSQQMAQAGQQGQNGQSGQQGQPGQNGQQANSQAGQQSQNGQQGQPGQNGQQNQSGQSSQNNQSGQQGQSGQSGQNSQQGQTGQNSQSGQQNQSGQSGQSGQQGQTGQSGQQGQSGHAGQSGQQGQPGQQGEGQQGQSGQGQGQGQGQGDQAGAAGAGQGQGSSAGQSGTGDSSTRNDAAGGGTGAGQGSGGAGDDVTSGAPTGQNGPGDSQNGSGNNGSTANNDYVYAPTFIGGDGGDKINPQSNNPLNPNDPTESGNFTNNPTGNSMLPIGDVVGEASSQADRAMDNDRVPGSLRSIIRNYFSGLQQ